MTKRPDEFTNPLESARHLIRADAFRIGFWLMRVFLWLNFSPKAKPPPTSGGFSFYSWLSPQAGLNSFSRPREASAGAQPFTALYGLAGKAAHFGNQSVTRNLFDHCIDGGLIAQNVKESIIWLPIVAKVGCSQQANRFYFGTVKSQCLAETEGLDAQNVCILKRDKPRKYLAKILPSTLARVSSLRLRGLIPSIFHFRAPQIMCATLKRSARSGRLINSARAIEWRCKFI